MTIYSSFGISTYRNIVVQNMNNENNIWVLVDFRTGTSVQAIALADSLGLKYQVKKIEYNIFASLTNFFLTYGLHLKSSSKKELITDTPPKIIISAGRRAAAVAAYLKSIYKGVKLIQIMKPDLNINIFDYLILPQHDSFNDKSNSKCKIVRSIGSLNNVYFKIENYKEDILSKYSPMKSFVGVLIGGDTKEYKFSYKDGLNLSNVIENAISYNGLPAFITFSRRTPEHVKKIFRKKFEWPNIIYDPASNEANPYIAILKYAKFLIITCDSVSMISEAASTGKPLYIYSPDKFSSKKHKYLIQQLIDIGIAKIINSSTGIFEEYHYPPLNELQKVSEYITHELLLNTN